MPARDPMSSATCETCGQVFHVTSSGRVCRCGLHLLSEDDRKDLIEAGATWSECPCDSPDWKPSKKHFHACNPAVVCDGECPFCDGEGEVECDMCDGFGADGDCTECDGEGEVKCDHCGEYTDCKKCDGAGSFPCGDCRGTGVIVCDHCGGAGVILSD